MNEKHYHAILYTVLSSYGADIIANPESAKGRADLLLKFKDVNYIFELKYDGTTRSAFEQLDDKDYIAVAFENEHLTPPIFDNIVLSSVLNFWSPNVSSKLPRIEFNLLFATILFFNLSTSKTSCFLI
mgnify:CR=1 FL=1